MNEAREFSGSSMRARVTAATLALGHGIDIWSLAVLTLSLAILLFAELTLFVTVVIWFSILAGCAQKYFALRVAFDEQIFRHWADTWQRISIQDTASVVHDSDMITFDHAMAACGLMKSAGSMTKNLEDRIQGAIALFKKQLLALFMQLMALLVTIFPIFI